MCHFFNSIGVVFLATLARGSHANPIPSRIGVERMVFLISFQKFLSYICFYFVFVFVSCNALRYTKAEMQTCRLQNLLQLSVTINYLIWNEMLSNIAHLFFLRRKIPVCAQLYRWFFTQCKWILIFIAHLYYCNLPIFAFSWNQK